MTHQIEIERYEVEAIDSLHSVIEAMCIAPSIVTRMTVDGRFAMSDSGPLQISNLECMKKAHGNVLLFGLGLGLVIGPILAKNDVKKVTVIEYLQEIIDAVVPSYDDDRLVLVKGDARDWQPPEGEVYDTIYFDIFTDRTRANIPKMHELMDRYRPYLNPDNPDAWIECFYRPELTSLRRAAYSLKLEIDRILRWCDLNPDKVEIPFDPESDISNEEGVDIVAENEALKEENWRLKREIEHVSDSMPIDWDDLIRDLEDDE